jgi:hypothetical protein
MTDIKHKGWFYIPPAVIVCALLLCVAFGSEARAAVTLSVSHRTSAIVMDGVSDYNPGGNLYPPQLRRIDLAPVNAPLVQGGSLSLSLDGGAEALFEGDSVSVEFLEDVTLPIWYDNAAGEYFVGDEEGARCYFIGNSENTLSERPFLMTLGIINSTGSLPDIRSVKRQMEDIRCVPKLDLIKSGDLLSDVKISFVDPKNMETALRKSDWNDVKNISRMVVYDKSQQVIQSLPVDYSPQSGSLIETNVRLAEKIDVNEIYYISVYFDFEAAQGVNSSITYVWDNRLAWSSSSGSGSGDSDSSESESGGCSAGFGTAILALAALLLSKKRRG